MKTRTVLSYVTVLPSEFKKPLGLKVNDGIMLVKVRTYEVCPMKCGHKKLVKTKLKIELFKYD